MPSTRHTKSSKSMSADAGQAVTEVAGGPSNAARPTVSASSPLSSPTKPDTTLGAPSALSLPTAPTDSAQPATASADAAGAAAPAQAGPSSTQSATAEGPAPPPKYLQPSELYVSLPFTYVRPDPRLDLLTPATPLTTTRPQPSRPRTPAATSHPKMTALPPGVSQFSVRLSKSSSTLRPT